MSDVRIVILDLELTAWEGSLKRQWAGVDEEPEIVQIGAVKLKNDPNLTEVGALDLLVKPTINAKLSAYFINLTGITNDQLTALGVDFDDALGRLTDFICRNTVAIYSFGNDDEILHYNCRLNDLDPPFKDLEFIDIHRRIADIKGEAFKNIRSSQLPDAFGFPSMGAAHQAVNDARCIAQALRILRQEGEF